MSYQMILSDEEYEALAEQYQAFGAQLSAALEQYDGALDSILTAAIPSGAVHDALALYREYALGMRIAAENVGEKFARIVKSMIEKVDDIDEYLYNPGQGFARDFSQEQYDRLLGCLDHPLSNVTDHAGDWLYGKFLGLADLFHWDNVKRYLAESYRFLLDYNNETKAGLTRLFDNANQVDYDFGNSIPGATPTDGDYYTCHFDNISLTMILLRDMMNEMADIIDPSNGRFTVESIKSRMEPLYTDMKKYFQNAMSIPEFSEQPTLEEISEFAGHPWSKTYFSGFNAARGDFVSELGGTDAVLMTIFGMFDITKSKIIYGDYEVYTTKKQLLAVLKELGETRELYAGTASEDAIEDCKTLLKYYKEYGGDFYDFLNTHRQKNGKLILDGRTIEAKHYKSFLESLDNAGFILKEGEKGIEYLATMMADYENALEILDSFEANYSGDEKTMQAVTEIRALFEKEFSAYLEETSALIKDVGYDVAMKTLGKATPVMAVVSAIEEGIEITGDVTGLGVRAKRTMDALTLDSLSSASGEAYSKALSAFQNADPSDENYEQLAQDVKNCFELHKKNLEETFSAMADATTGDRHSYYKYCESLARNADMNSSGEINVLSFEEFLKQYDR
jgi:hypothetical protein